MTGSGIVLLKAIRTCCLIINMSQGVGVKARMIKVGTHLLMREKLRRL